MLNGKAIATTHQNIKAVLPEPRVYNYYFKVLKGEAIATTQKKIKLVLPDRRVYNFYF